MKKISLYFFAIIVIISCNEKTAENSQYAVQISELNTILTEVEINYFKFLDYELDSITKIRKTASEKYKKVKAYYKSDTVNIVYESIMLTYKGQMIKRLKGIEGQHKGIIKEVEYSKNQIKDLTQKLIKEEFNKVDSEKYYTQEKNALLELNRNINAYNATASNIFSINDNLTEKIDSIINANEPIQ
jgi:hypothetical protein